MVTQVRELTGKPDYSEHSYGLYSVVEPVTDPDFRPDETIQWVEWCGKVRTITSPCEDSPGEVPPVERVKVSDSSGIFEADGPILYFKPTCDSPMSSTEQVVTEAATDIASATEQKVVERELWTNVLEGCEAAIENCSDVRAAIGAVEQSLAWQLPGTGMIHVPMWAISYLTDVGILEKVNGQFRTLSGTPVAAGVGYFGPPGGLEEVDGFYIVGTGTVRVVRTPPFRTIYVFDSDNNTHHTLTERKIAVGYGCVCVYAAVTTTCIPEPFDTEESP